MKTHKLAGAFMGFVLMTFLLVGCIRMPSPGLSVEHKPIEGPGRFDIKIIIINATLTGPITCDSGVTITPSGPPYVQDHQEIIVAILEIPPSFLRGMVTCFVPTSAKRFPFAIWVGPPGPPKVPPPQIPLSFSWDKKNISCEFASQKVALQVMMRNELSEPVTVIRIKSVNDMLTLIRASPPAPLIIAPKERKALSLDFACNIFGFAVRPFVELTLADDSVIIL